MHTYTKMYTITALLLLYTTFLIAYLNPTKSTLVTINMFGEADIEIFMLTFLIPLSIFFLLLELRWMLKPAGKASASQSAQSQ